MGEVIRKGKEAGSGSLKEHSKAKIVTQEESKRETNRLILLIIYRTDLHTEKRGEAGKIKL